MTAPALLSAVHRGVAFEQRSRELLRAHLSMALRRVGGRADGGVDLAGWWWLPSAGAPGPRTRVRVLGQCKAERRKAGPALVREMEGVLGALADPAALALVVAEAPFSPAALLRAHASRVPFFLLHLPPGGGVGAAMWNPALGGPHGLLRGELELRWERTASGEGRPGLWKDDTRLPSEVVEEVSDMEDACQSGS